MWTAALVIGLGQTLNASDEAYVNTQLRLRKQLEAGLRGPNGWLSVAGLMWLQDGDRMTFAVNTDGHLLLPCSVDREPIGEFVRHGNSVSLNIFSTNLTVNGKPTLGGEIHSDADMVGAGDISIMVIKRGARIGLRVYDPNSDARRHFEGQKWFPVDPKFRIKAKFVAYDKPRTMPITNVLGDTQPVPNPGYVEFSVGGKKCRLEAQDSGAGLFFNFRDLTSGKSTYPPGRFLDTAKPKDGYVWLDFNQAVNPPCAFTAYATCPLPPKGNDLKVEIRAGELTHHPYEPK